MTAEEEILGAAKVLFVPGDVVELRIFGSMNGRPRIEAGYFVDFVKMAAEAAKFSGRPGIEGVYWTLNPCVKALLARAVNHVTTLKTTTANKDIEKRSRFLIDVDPVRPSGISATEEEKKAAIEVTRSICCYLRKEQWPEPFVGDSGNGYHLIYRLDLPNDDPARDLIQACLKSLAAMFDNNAVKVDTDVYNAGRISKAYGTVAAKGDWTPERPHRQAHLVQVPKSAGIVSRELLEALAAKVPKQSETRRTTQSNSEGKITPEKVEEFLAEAGIEHRGRIPYDSGWKWQLERCWFDASHTATSVIVILDASGPLVYHCSHNSCKGNDWHKFRASVQQKIGPFRFLDHPYTASVEWANPLPLGDDLPAVESFRPDFLPKSFLPLIEDTSERMQVPMDYAAANVIVALAASVGRRATMQPKMEDTSWLVVPNLWGGVIAPPGYLKSPVQRLMTRPLTNIEEVWRQQYDAEAEAYALVRRESKLAWEAWDEQVKQALKKGTPKPDPPGKNQDPPIQKRLLLASATFEKLHEILKDNPSGVLVLRDELTGWLAELDKPGREAERQFYLEGWNGDTPFTVDRIGRGSIHVPATCISLLGNIQPGRLRSYLSDAVVGGPNDDGLMQRFQILVWPDPPREWKLIDRPPDNYAVMLAEKVFSRLANLPNNPPLAMRFDPESQELFFAWLARLEGKVRTERGLHPAIVAHLSKYRSLMPSLAALFELADRAASAGELGDKISVSTEHTQQATALCQYLESHAKRAYSCIVSPELRAARELSRHIEAGDLRSRFTTREVYFRGWSGLDDPERARNACKALEDAAWIRQEVTPRSQRGGRPSESWEINPAVIREN
jgi:hypothetical protein